MLVHWIWLATRPGLNDRDKLALLDQFADPEDVYYADSSTIGTIPGLSVAQNDALLDKNLTEAEQIADRCAKEKIRILTYRDAAYPAKLRSIADPPLVLYCKGILPDFDGRPMIGVVGTRKCSAYGVATAQLMGAQIAQCGGIVVTGMAAGIDTGAVEGVFSVGGLPVGVLGCGVDVVYPASNKALFAKMENQGCLLSEYPPGTPPYRWNFPKRNRLISGLSCGVLVIEAPERSGSLITARQAAEQGRDVFVVPGNIDSLTCQGSNALLRDGAISVFSGWDILSEYDAQFPGKLRNEQTQAPLKVAQTPRTLEINPPSRAKKDKKVIDNGAKPLYIDVEKKLPTLTKEEQAIVKQLYQGPRLSDEVIADAGIPAGRVLAVMTVLEVKGVIRRLPGNRVALKEI